jgi:hypothetical protein
MTHGNKGDAVQHRGMARVASRGVPIMLRSGEHCPRGRSTRENIMKPELIFLILFPLLEVVRNVSTLDTKGR